jgi:transposase-like protein
MNLSTRYLGMKLRTPLVPGSLQGTAFDQEIIVLCVRWYLTFKLSFRDLVQMMAERGIAITHTTISRCRAACGYALAST